MLQKKHHLQISLMDESIYSPWEFTEAEQDDSHFLPPSLALLNGPSEDQQHQFFPEHQSCQLEPPLLKRHITTRSTIHSPRTYKRKETGSRKAEKCYQPQQYSNKVDQNQLKRRRIRQSKSLNETEESIFFTNNVICFKLNPQTKRSASKPQNNKQKSKQKGLNKSFLWNSQGYSTYFSGFKAQKMSFQRNVNEIKMKQYSKLFERQTQRKVQCENFAIKRNMLRIGKSRKLAQML